MRETSSSAERETAHETPIADGPIQEWDGTRPCEIRHLPESLLLQIFREVEAVPSDSWGKCDQESCRVSFADVSDDSLEQLIDGYQMRCELPLVCKRWYNCLSEPSFVWAYLHIGFHELWSVQERFVDKELLLGWIRQRAAAFRHVQLDFDSWCRHYYQGGFSAVQAGSTIAQLLQLMPGLQQLKIQDQSFAVNSALLNGLASATNLRHLQLFGVSSDVLVADALSCITQLSQLQNLELADCPDHRARVQQQHPSFFPTQICNLPNLITLHIQSPLVTYTDSAITALSNLNTLVINGSSLTLVSPVLTKLQHLHTLCLADNASLALDKSPDTWWPEELTRLTGLTNLDLSSCGINSGVAVSIGKLEKLSHLALGDNQAPPGIMLPLELGSCTSLHSLCMNGCMLRQMPDCLYRMGAMEVLGLGNNILTELPDALTRLTQLRDLDLAHNCFRSFPEVLAGLTSLERINFTGCTEMQIPTPLGMLSNLRKLTALIFTCDLSRDAPRWSADSTSNLISLAIEFTKSNGRGTNVLML